MKRPPSPPVRAYHGSGTRIERFDYAFTGVGTDQNGSGFYFTTSAEEAASYCGATLNGQPKPGGTDAPTVHAVHLRLTRPLESDVLGELTASQVRAFLARSPRLDEALENYGEVNYEGREAVIRRVIANYTPGDGEPAPLLRWLHAVSNDFFDGEVEAFNRAVFAALGYDAVVERFPEHGKIHYVAFFPEQIEILEHLTPDEALAIEERPALPLQECQP